MWGDGKIVEDEIVDNMVAIVDIVDIVDMVDNVIILVPWFQVCEEGKIKVKSKALIKKIQSSDTEKKYLSFLD